MATKEKKTKKVAQKGAAVVTETRQALMLKAKEIGIKNFRVLNRDELVQVLSKDVTQELVDKVVTGAVARWKSGWGTKKRQK